MDSRLWFFCDFDYPVMPISVTWRAWTTLVSCRYLNPFSTFPSVYAEIYCPILAYIGADTVTSEYMTYYIASVNTITCVQTTAVNIKCVSPALILLQPVGLRDYIIRWAKISDIDAVFAHYRKSFSVIFTARCYAQRGDTTATVSRLIRPSVCLCMTMRYDHLFIYLFICIRHTPFTCHGTGCPRPSAADGQRCYL